MAAADSRGLDSSPVISVVVCTWNRADLLVNAVGSLGDQTLDDSLFEIIVVNNNSDDRTSVVIEELCGHYPNMRHCFEPQQGLSFARNLGWQIAQGTYVGYIDDDCKVPEQWLAEAKNVIETHSPGLFGGPYFAFHNTSRPRWFKDSYGSHEHADRARPLTQNEYLSGGNIFFRRTLLETMGGFDTSLGMAGEEIAFGEETALLRRIRSALPDELIYYEPRLYVYHLVRPEKMTIRWTMKERFAGGRCWYRVIHGEGPPGIARRQLLKDSLRAMGALGLDIGRGVLRRDRTLYPYFQNYLYERAFRHLQTLGMLYEQYRGAAERPPNMGPEQSSV